MRAATAPPGSASQFSKNRPEVVISWAERLAYVARTAELLDTRVRGVEATASVSELCPFVTERVDGPTMARSTQSHRRGRLERLIQMT
jgi:hypothetical protein